MTKITHDTSWNGNQPMVRMAEVDNRDSNDDEGQTPYTTGTPIKHPTTNHLFTIKFNKDICIDAIKGWRK